MKIDIDSLTIDEAVELANRLKEKLTMAKRAVNGHIYNSHQRMGAPLRADYSTFDWEKADSDLAKEHNIGRETIKRHRLILGKPHVKKTKWWPACKDWDWTKSDTEICRLVGCAIASVRDYRHRLGHPTVAYDHGSGLAQPGALPERFDWSKADWNLTDSDNARLIGCTRERARQKRAEMKQPRRYKWHINIEKFKEAFGDRTELAWSEVEGKYPFTKYVFRRYCAQLGIKIKLDPLKGNPPIIPWHLMNWDIPTILLADIWGVKYHTMAMHKANYLIKKASFWCVKGHYLPEFESVVHHEREKAAQHKVTPHRERE